MSGPSTTPATDFAHADLQRFSPLNQIAAKYQLRLQSGLRVRQINKGNTLIRKNREQGVLHFLVDGELEIRNSFENRDTLTQNDKRAGRAIENLLSPQSTVRALSHCQVLVCEQKVIDELLSWTQDYSIHFLEDGELPLAETNLIDDDFQEDWDNVFIQSALASNLSHQAISELLAGVENIEVAAGDTIVKRGSEADYFYIIKEGDAVVQTDPDGPYRGAEFHLHPGNYFGDEALIAHTVRNSCVKMATRGLLGRLNQERFETLIKSHLVLPDSQINENAGKQPRLTIDVRFEIEAKLSPIEGSQLIPVPQLRKQLTDMDHSKLYVVSPANDVRSELAVYLMRQAGLNAYLQT